MKRPTAGLTLIELLVGLALIGIVLATLLSLTIGTARPSAALQARNDLLPELQTAQNYMAGKLREASYIFPVGNNVQLTNTGITTNKPSGGSTVGSGQNWVVGTDPIIAFIIPPKTVTPSGCALATTFTKDDYCYAFYAFYAISRSALVDTVTGITGAGNPGTDSLNDATSWVLMEYRGYYSAFGANPIYPVSGFSVTENLIPKGNTGRLLMDFLPAQYSGTTKLFATNAASVIQVAGLTSVTMNLAAQQIVAGQTVRIPSSVATEFNTLTVYPRNVGKPQLLN